MDNPSLVSSLTSWFTPTSLFIFLNLMIGTIFLTTRLASHTPNHPPSQPLARSSSLLDRVRSINFSHFNFHLPPDPLDPYPPQLERAPSLLERVRSFKLSRFSTSEPEPDPNPGLGLDHQVRSSNSEPRLDPLDPSPPQLERVPSLLERVLSFKLSRFNTSEPEPDPNPGLGLDHQVRRSKSEPREDQKVSIEEENKEKLKSGLVRTVSLGDEAVDAKADDFINRFKQQLKLQRLDSLLRYKQRNA